MNVDPLAEQFQGWTPYHYVHQNPINLIDPTGMSAQDPEGGCFWNKVKSFLGINSTQKPTQQASDDSTLLDEVVIPANRKPNWFQRTFSRDKFSNDIKNNKQKSGWNHLVNWFDKLDLSGGVYMYDDDKGKGKGAQSIRKTNNNGRPLEAINVGGVMQLGGFAKSWDGTGFKYSQENLDLERFAKISNANITGFNLGGTIGDKANQGIDSIRVWLFNGSKDSIPIQLTPSGNMMLRNYNSANGDKFRDSLRKKRGYFNTYK